MPIALPQSVKTLLLDKAYGHVVTTNEQGKPQVTMVWMDVDGDEVLFNTADGRRKVQNLRRDPRIIVSVQHRSDPQAYAVFHGKARITEAGADEQIDKLAKRFTGADKYHVPSARREATARAHQRRSNRRLRSQDATLVLAAVLVLSPLSLVRPWSLVVLRPSAWSPQSFEGRTAELD